MNVKKIIYFWFISIVIFFLINVIRPIISDATTNATVYIQSDTQVIEQGEEIEIQFGIKEQKTAAYIANIYFDETKFEWVSGPENINIDGNVVKVLWYDVQGGSGAIQGELGKMTFRAKENGLANFVINGEFFTEKGQLIQTDFECLQVQIGKEETNFEKQKQQAKEISTQTNNSNLQSLRIDIEGIVPDFNKDIYNYDLVIPNDINDIEVLAIAENLNSKVEITGNKRIKRRSK